MLWLVDKADALQFPPPSSSPQTAAHIAMCHELEDVADSIVVNLSKIPGGVAHVTGARPEVVFGRALKMRAVTWTISSISIK